MKSASQTGTLSSFRYTCELGGGAVWVALLLATQWCLLNKKPFASPPISWLPHPQKCTHTLQQRHLSKQRPSTCSWISSGKEAF